MIFKKILFLFLFSIAICFCQDKSQIGIVTGKGTTYIPVFIRQGMTYIPVTLFADVLGIKYSILSENERIKFHFPQYNLIITSKNPYLILESKENPQEIVQLPTSTYMINNQIYVPLMYSMRTLEKALGTSLDFKEPDLITVEEFKKKEESEIKNFKSNKQFSITGLSLNEKANGTLIRIRSEKRIPSSTSSFPVSILSIPFPPASADVNNLQKSGE